MAEILNPVPVNLITGFLGVGKTTAIRHLLAAKPADQYWAVLVNEFGDIGMDAAAIGTADDFAVVEVPGGCICCTTSPMLRVSLARLLRARRPDRLLIEPSGLGHASAIVDLLHAPGLATALDWRTVITLIDPRHLDDTRYTGNAIWRDQVALADVLVANKCDRADAEQVDRFAVMAAKLFPPKQATPTTLQGRIDLALLDLVNQAPRRPASPYRPIVTRQEAGIDSQGWTWPPDICFDAEQLATLFQALNDAGQWSLPPILRAKAVFHTHRGWLLFNWVDGEAHATEIAWRRDSRCEVILSTASDNWQVFERAIESARGLSSLQGISKHPGA